MKIGVTFPQTEIGHDPVILRDYAQTAEELGFDHILAYDHVLGAHVSNRPDWGTRYSDKDSFHEPFVMFGYMAAFTSRIEFVTGVLILPQRQTVLVAKQAAEVDVLSGGRLRLGIGLGWNDVEYEALNEDFHNRGRRVEEQVEVLRRLWTQPSVDFDGKWHRIDRAGLNPMPVQQPIPIFMGGASEAVLERAARISNGWFPMVREPADIEALPGRIEALKRQVESNGRDPEAFKIQVSAGIANKGPEDWAKDVEMFEGMGADYLCFSTMGAGLANPRDHIDTMRRYKEAIG